MRNWFAPQLLFEHALQMYAFTVVLQKPDRNSSTAQVVLGQRLHMNPVVIAEQLPVRS